MKGKIQHLLKDLKKGLLRLYGRRLKLVVLYGSYARGDNEDGSDLDVLVVLSDFERAPLEINRTSQLVGELSLEHLITISPAFMREQDWLLADKPFLRNIRTDGVAV